MRSLILIVTLLLSWNAQAAPVCARVHAGDQKIDSFHHWRDESDAMFKKQLHGDPQKGQSELYFTWSIWNPIDLQRIDSRSFHRVFSHKRRVVFRNNDDLNSSSPLVRVGKFGATQDYQNEFVLRETYKNYDGRIQDQIIQMILKVEEHIGEVADVRQEMGFVATGEP